MKAETFFTNKGNFIFDKLEKENDIHNFDSPPNGYFEICLPSNEPGQNKVVAMADIFAGTITFLTTFPFTEELLKEIFSEMKKD